MRKSFGSNVIWNSVGTIFYFGCQWLLTVVVVRLNGGYSDAGVLSLAMSVSNPLTFIACLNLRNFQVSELENKFSDGDFIANRILTSVVSIILCICVVVYKGYSNYESMCIIAFMVYKAFEALVDVLHGIDQKAWRLDIAGKSLILRGFTVLISIVCGVIFGSKLSFTIWFMTLLSCLVIFFYDFRQCAKQIHPNFFYNPRKAISLTKIGIPLAVYSILLTLISTYPRLQIEAQYGEEMLGIFASIATPTVLVTQLASLIFIPLMGVFAEYRKMCDKKRLHKVLLGVLGSTLMIGVISVIAGKMLGEWALVLLFGESIREYAYLLIPIMFTAILSAIIWLFCGLLIVFKDYYVLAIFTFISLFVCLISAPYLIAEKQLMGAALSLAMALVVETVLLSARLIHLFYREKLLS